MLSLISAGRRTSACAAGSPSSAAAARVRRERRGEFIKRRNEPTIFAETAGVSSVLVASPAAAELGGTSHPFYVDFHWRARVNTSARNRRSCGRPPLLRTGRT